MKRPRLSRLLVFFCIGVVLIAAVLFVLSSRKAWVASRRLSSALHSAREVRFVEFARGFFSGELVFDSVTATPADIGRLKSATSPWLAAIPPWKSRCFTPHHRVEITRADGSQTRFEICFHCHNFRFESEKVTTLSSRWQTSLASFFASVGMPSRSLEEYQGLIKRHPDHEQLRDIDRQLELFPLH